MKLKDLLPRSIPPGTEADAIALLRADHDRIEDLFSRFDELKCGREGTETRLVVDELCREFRLHSMLEEELFYPAVRAAIGDDDLMNEACIEHEGARRLVAELERTEASDAMLTARMHVLDAYITHHVREEEENIFPKARESGVDLGALAIKMGRRKGQLLRESAHPAVASATRRSRARPASEPRAPR